MATKTKIEIEMPKEFIGTSEWHDNKIIAFLTVDHDHDPCNPTDDDGMGKMHSFSAKHYNFIAPEGRGALLEKCPDAVGLSYYEHGLCLWGVDGTGVVPSCQWDSVQFAGLWTPDEHLVQVANKKGLEGEARIKQMQEWAKQCCEVYTEWANGSVYGFSINVYKIRKEDSNVFNDIDDYRFDDELYEDSCSGFYGMEDTEAAVKDAIDNIDLTS